MSYGILLRLFRSPHEDEQIVPFIPTLGSWAAGVVLETGRRSSFKPGDLVHGEWKHRQTAITDAALYQSIRRRISYNGLHRSGALRSRGSP
jgi:hypothetical protein